MGVYLGLWQGSEQVDHRLRRFKLQHFQSLSCLWLGVSHLPDGSVGAQQLRQLNLFQVIADVAPRILGGVFDHPFQEQRQNGDGDVGMDAMGK